MRLEALQHQCEVTQSLDMTHVREKSVRQTIFSRLPSVLCFHIGRRFFCQQSGRMVKLRQQVKFPLVLDMSPFAGYGGILTDAVSAPSVLAGSARTAPRRGVSADEVDEADARRRSTSTHPHFTYFLRSIIQHHGSADSGHYTAFRRISEALDRWVHISDDSVRHVNVDQVLSCEAYMLFYDRSDKAQTHT